MKTPLVNYIYHIGCWCQKWLLGKWLREKVRARIRVKVGTFFSWSKYDEHLFLCWFSSLSMNI